MVVSTRDRALLMSAMIRGDEARVGTAATAGSFKDLDVNVIDLSNVKAGGGLGHFAVANSPEVDRSAPRVSARPASTFVSTGRQAGIIGTSVALVQRGTEIAISPLAGK